jgi:hypothetical protein
MSFLLQQRNTIARCLFVRELLVKIAVNIAEVLSRYSSYHTHQPTRVQEYHTRTGTPRMTTSSVFHHNWRHRCYHFGCRCQQQHNIVIVVFYLLLLFSTFLAVFSDIFSKNTYFGKILSNFLVLLGYESYFQLLITSSHVEFHYFRFWFKVKFVKNLPFHRNQSYFYKIQLSILINKLKMDN